MYSGNGCAPQKETFSLSLVLTANKFSCMNRGLTRQTRVFVSSSLLCVWQLRMSSWRRAEGKKRVHCPHFFPKEENGRLETSWLRRERAADSSPLIAVVTQELSIPLEWDDKSLARGGEKAGDDVVSSYYVDRKSKEPNPHPPSTITNA